MAEGLTFDQNVMKFRVSHGQKILAVIVFICFIGLSTSIVQSNRYSVSQAKMLTDAEAPSTSIIFTQRESLVYTVRLAQWLDQQMDRRDVQIARALLAQRLAVINADGKSVGEEAPPGYMAALLSTDTSLAKGNPGILTTANRVKLLPEVNAEIESLISQARLLVTDYQLAVDNQLIYNAKSSRYGDYITLILLILFMTLAFSWFAWITNSSIKQYRRGRELIVTERSRLEVLANELEATNLMVFELESLNESKNEFISNISHELRTPLTSIIGYVDILSESYKSGADPQMDMAFEVLDRNATILLSIVQSLLSLSKLDSPNNVYLTKQIHLLEIAEDAIFILQGEVANKNISVDFSYEKLDDFFVAGDAGLLSQLVINLLANAIKFSDESASIEIILKKKFVQGSGQMVSLAIRDHGIGIPESEIERLFERFYRASNAVSQHIQGTGLGLSIVAKVADIHKAKVSIASKEGEGTTFTIDFPIYITQMEALIASRKYSLLSEAIVAIQVDDEKTLKEALHEYGGAIGFYDFPELGEALLALSREMESASGAAQESVLAARDEIVRQMQDVLAQNELGDVYAE